jgi:hypothetical protein
MDRTLVARELLLAAKDLTGAVDVGLIDSKVLVALQRAGISMSDIKDAKAFKDRVSLYFSEQPLGRRDVNALLKAGLKGLMVTGATFEQDIDLSGF